MSVEPYKNTEGRTMYSVRYIKPDGKRTRRRGFKLRRDAVLWEAQHVTQAKAAGTFVDTSNLNVTVSALYDSWIARKKMSIKPSYLDDLEQAWEKYVRPVWAGVPLTKINQSAVQAWVLSISNGEFDGKKKSPSVVLRAHGVLASLLDDGVKAHKLAFNPARGIELPRKPRKTKHEYLSMEQLLALAQASGEHQALVLLLGFTGLRWGEAVGLLVKDVHPDKHRIDVYKSATQVGSQIVVGTPKTHEIRTVMYPSALDKVLDLDKPGNALLFENQRGGYLKHPKARTGGSWFAKACDAAGIPRMTIHDLRHTAASLMVASGANVKVVQRQLGHASASMTLDVYADLFDDDLDTVRERLNSQLFGHILDTFSGKLMQKSDK